ncbi:MAG: hypothetical protein EAZ89_06595 [Bacteroidetes bacterium]|nr:MAG: hypothetical protein EAZ89_06595 [Bacteroidota bacterium]
MNKILSSVFVAVFFLAFAGSSSAQNIAGTYTMKLSGKQVYTDRTPVEDAVSGDCSFTITQTGDEITVQMTGFQSEWSAHIMKGRVGNNRFIAVLASGTKSVYIIQGQVSGNTLTGNYTYIRYGDGTSGIVPGWTKVDYTATK